MHQHQQLEQDQQQLESSTLASSAAAVVSPSFRLIGSPPKISAAIDTNPQAHETVVEEDNSSSEFEFSFAVHDREQKQTIVAADEIFVDGRIKPIYPIFNRDLLLVHDEEHIVVEEEKNKPQLSERLPLHRLLLEEREALMVRSGSASSSSEAGDLDGVSPESYCVWAPPPTGERFSRKSRSTGSSLGGRLRNLVVGRSRSDGKAKFVSFSANTGDAIDQHNSSNRETVSTDSNSKKNKILESKSPKKEKKEIDVATAHRIFYSKADNGGGVGRKSYLPYRRDLVGFLANVNGVARPHRPF